MIRTMPRLLVWLYLPWVLRSIPNTELIRRLDKRAHIQKDSASWIMEIIADLQGLTKPYWQTVSKVERKRVEALVLPLAGKQMSVDSLVYIVGGLSLGEKTKENMILLICSREVLSSLLWNKKLAEYIGAEYDIEKRGRR